MIRNLLVAVIASGAALAANPGKAAVPPSRQMWPTLDATERLRDRVRALYAALLNRQDVQQAIPVLNSALCPVGDSVPTLTADHRLGKLDRCALRGMNAQGTLSGGQRLTNRTSRNSYQEHGQNPRRLRHAMRYPTHDTSTRPSIGSIRKPRAHPVKAGRMATDQHCKWNRAMANHS